MFKGELHYKINIKLKKEQKLIKSYNKRTYII